MLRLPMDQWIIRDDMLIMAMNRLIIHDVLHEYNHVTMEVIMITYSVEVVNMWRW